MLFGLFLVLIGALWLFSNLGYIAIPISEIFWPGVVIVVGLMFLLRRIEHHQIKCWFCDSEEEKGKSNKEENKNLA